MAVIRSASPLSKADELWVSNKIKALIESAHQRTDPHERWLEEDPLCKERFQRVATVLSKEHYKEVRIQDKKNRVDASAHKFKKQNSAQQVKPQHQKPAVSGLIPLGKLYQNRDGHMEGLEAELVHRGMSTEKVETLKIKARKDHLKRLETERRVRDDGLELSKAAEISKRHFRCLSGYEFIIVD